jgi:hypothetical protein
MMFKGLLPIFVFVAVAILTMFALLSGAHMLCMRGIKINNITITSPHTKKYCDEEMDDDDDDEMETGFTYGAIASIMAANH